MGNIVKYFKDTWQHHIKSSQFYILINIDVDIDIDVVVYIYILRVFLDCNFGYLFVQAFPWTVFIVNC